MAEIVLVHGAYGGAWNWELVADPLRARGHRVTTLDLPGAGEDHTPVEEITPRWLRLVSTDPCDRAD